MATHTDNYNLIKPDSTDFYNIDDFNDNADTIDAALKAHDNKISSLFVVNGTTLNITAPTSVVSVSGTTLTINI